MKLRKMRTSRSKQVRREIRLRSLCVFEAARARRGRPGDELAKESPFFCLTTPKDTKRARPAAPSRGTRRKPNHNHTRDAALTLLSDRSRVRCRVPARAAGSEGATRREVRRGASERQRTRADRETRQRKVDFPWRPIASRALHRAPRAPLVCSWCARAAPPHAGVLGERSGGSRSAHRAGGTKGAKPRTGVSRTASSEGARRSDFPPPSPARALRAACAAHPLALSALPRRRARSDA